MQSRHCNQKSRQRQDFLVKCVAFVAFALDFVTRKLRQRQNFRLQSKVQKLHQGQTKGKSVAKKATRGAVMIVTGLNLLTYDV